MTTFLKGSFSAQETDARNEIFRISHYNCERIE
jgi:hypothetical protein